MPLMEARSMSGHGLNARAQHEFVLRAGRHASAQVAQLMAATLKKLVVFFERRGHPQASACSLWTLWSSLPCSLRSLRPLFR